TCTIVTTSASEELAPIHERMPVIVDPANFEAWLDTSGGTEIAQSLLAADPPQELIAREISNRVNNVRNQDESILAPLPGR
ncbi:MAG: SOS response-associated peptidase family protein, partial [Kiloniellales bacterium]